jgi:hypothetical protein
MEITKIEMGHFIGTIRSFYGFKGEIDVHSIYKIWCESHRKTNFLAASYG